MKSLVVFLFLSLTTALFAQTFVVEEVVGDVKVLKNGVESVLEPGMILSNSRVKIPSGAYVVINGKKTVGPRDTVVSSLFVRIGGKVTESETKNVSSLRGSIPTASTRASDATRDLEWDEGSSDDLE